MKISRIILLVLLPFLGLFLGDWLLGQYEKEKKALKNEALLSAAQSVISNQDESLQELLEAIQSGPGKGNSDVEVKVINPSKGHSGLDQGFSGTVLYADSLGHLWDGDGGLVSGQEIEDREIESQAFWKVLPLAMLVSSIYLLLILSIYFLDRSHKREKRLLEAKNNFISNMAHELNTPVSTISIALEALEDFHGLQDEEKTRNYLKISRAQIQKLSGTIVQVLEAMKLEHGKTLYQPLKTDLIELTTSVIDSLQVQIDQRKIQMILDPGGHSLSVEADPMHLGNAIRNVLDNAIKYSAVGDRVWMELNQVGAEVELRVKDEGKGIALADQNRIFERFFRSESGVVHTVNGTGLGLSYAREVIEHHQGTIRVKSKPGDTIFTITLPLSP